MRALLATTRAAARDLAANRGSLLVQALMMIVNDVTWVLFWGFFFGRTGAVRGWSFDDVVVLFAIMVTAGGLALGVFHNVRQIGRMAAESAFDETLVLPVSPLGFTLARQLEATHLGDLLFGPALFLVAGHPTPGRCLLFVVGALAGAVVLAAFLVICGSLTFFIGGSGEQSELAFNAVLILSSYPLDFFGGPTRLILFTAVPAAFVTGLPARMVQHADAQALAVEISVAAAFALVSWATFSLGLRRYSSGSVWSR